MDFSKLKANRNTTISSLLTELDKTAQKNYDDDRFWKPEQDKSGNGYAVIRFLPAGPKDELPWVRLWSHGFQGPSGKWYIQNSLTTLNQPDPLTDLNSKLWSTGTKENQDLVRSRKRKLNYISNILVVSDPKHPENEGKIFLFKYGKKIFDKINEVMNPQFADEKAVNPFDFWEGANFKLKIRKFEGYPNYDKSEFEPPTPLLGGDDKKLEALWNKQHHLGEFLEPKNFKTYEELQKILDSVLGTPTEAPKSQISKPKFVAEDGGDDAPWDNSETTEDSDLSYFQKLAEG